MFETARRLRLRALMSTHGLSKEDVAALLGFTLVHVRAMHKGSTPIHPRTIRLLELELAERARGENQRRRALRA
jgi:hypothetical protein